MPPAWAANRDHRGHGGNDPDVIGKKMKGNGQQLAAGNSCITLPIILHIMINHAV
jgi:hypothetical protein